MSSRTFAPVVAHGRTVVRQLKAGLLALGICVAMPDQVLAQAGVVAGTVVIYGQQKIAREISE